MNGYSGGWEGIVDNKKAFNLQVEIEEKRPDFFTLNVFSFQPIIKKEILRSNEVFFLKIDENLTFTGRFNKDKSAIRGFFKSGLLLYHVELKKSSAHKFSGQWNILMVDSLKNQNLYLSIENTSEENFEAYPIFGDNRFTGTWCANFKKENDSIFFTDYKTGLNFKGKLKGEKIELGIYLADKILTGVDLKKSKNQWDIGIETSSYRESINNVQLEEMESLIFKGSLPNTHSVLISKKDSIAYEKYFYGYNAIIPHDMRSASKSISSAIVGIAMDRSILQSLDQSVFDFLPSEIKTYNNPKKIKIDLKSLLTMSSGLDAIDFGIERKSVASEDNYQPTPDWTKTIVEAPMINLPNHQAFYGSANPYLLGVAMDSAVTERVELFMDLHLFQPLGISNYIIQTDMVGRPYFGGGMYLTPRDMLKFGQLYLQKGKWNGKRVLSKKWVEDSFSAYHVLENTPDKNEYGYLWWHNQYNIDGKWIKSFEARGAGGQYIFVIPAMEIVVVITSGNYRNGKTQQPEFILENYILPIVVND